MATQQLTAADKLILYNQVVANHKDAVRKGATIPYTSLNGNMYSYLSKDGFVALRLPEAERTKFLEKYKTTLVTAYGIVQKEYVTVPDTLLQKTDELQPYFDISYGYASTLKAKASKKKKE